MPEDQNIKQSHEDGKIESPKEEVNENTSQEQPIQQTETTNPKSEIQKSEIKNMEVHHHPDLHHKKKHWKEYFLEFLMIFLAVTLGFFAENIREHLSDTGKEKHYIINLVQDLKIDITNTDTAIRDLTYLMNEIDSALQIPTGQLHNLARQDSFYYHFLFFFNSEIGFHQDDNTLIQLRNAGGYSLIKKPGVTDSIIALVQFYDRVKYNEDFYHDDFLKVEDFTSRVIKVPVLLSTDAGLGAVFPPLLNEKEIFTQYDKSLLEQLYSLIRIERSQMDFYTLMIEEYKKKATDLIAFLQKEYNLQ